jgi:hypothetical protein
MIHLHVPLVPWLKTYLEPFVTHLRGFLTMDNGSMQATGSTSHDWLIRSPFDLKDARCNK